MRMRNESKNFTAETAKTAEIRNSEFGTQINDSNINVQNWFIPIWGSSDSGWGVICLFL